MLRHIKRVFWLHIQKCFSSEEACQPFLRLSHGKCTVLSAHKVLSALQYSSSATQGWRYQHSSGISFVARQSVKGQKDWQSITLFVTTDTTSLVLIFSLQGLHSPLLSKEKNSSDFGANVLCEKSRVIRSSSSHERWKRIWWILNSKSPTSNTSSS